MDGEGQIKTIRNAQEGASKHTILACVYKSQATSTYQSKVTTMQKKKALDVAVENVSAESLSFAGLLCIGDQHCKPQSVHVFPPPPTNNTTHIRKEDLDFEFGSATPGSTPDALNNNSLADVLFSNGQLVPQAIPLQKSQSQVFEHVNSKDLLRTPHSNNRRSSGNEVSANGSAKKTNTEVRNKANKQRTTASQWFGQKIIQSFATPCRNCRASQPSPSLRHCDKEI